MRVSLWSDKKIPFFSARQRTGFTQFLGAISNLLRTKIINILTVSNHVPSGYFLVKFLFVVAVHTYADICCQNTRAWKPLRGFLRGISLISAPCKTKKQEQDKGGIFVKDTTFNTVGGNRKYTVL